MELKEIIGSKYEIVKLLKQSESSEVGICINKYIGSEWLIKFLSKTYENLHEMNHLLLLDHPRIPKIIDIMYTESGSYYVLEKLRGERFDVYFSAEKVSLSALIKVFVELTAILDHIHCKGITHGDLKPENILIDSEVGVGIIDFGSSFTTDDSNSFTESYVAPERLLDTYKADERSDIYSVGVLLKETLDDYQKRHLLSRKKLKYKKLLNLSKKCLRLHPDLRINQSIDLHDALLKLL